MNAKLCVAFAAVLLACAASTASAQQCFAIHTGYKSSISLGALSIYGGCIQGKVENSQYAPGGKICAAPGQESGTGNFATRAACCAALEPEAKGPNPMTNEPRPWNKNIKEVCLSGKGLSDKEVEALKAAAAGAASGQCFAIHTGYKTSIPLGTMSIYGGCIQGKVEDSQYAPGGKICAAPGQEGGTGNFATRAACCAALEPRVLGPNPQTMEPRPWNKNIKEVCLSGKGISDKEDQALTAAASAPRNWVVFKGQDLPAAADIPDMSDGVVGSTYIKVCRGLEGTAAACKAFAKCVAFTFGGDNTCGYLKARIVDNKGASLFYPSPKWTTYVLAETVKAAGKATLPSNPGSLKA